LKVELNKADLAEIKLLLGGVKNAAPKVLTRGINKTLTGVNTTAKREVAKRYNLTQKRIAQNFKTYKARFDFIRGKWDSTGKPIGLISFKGTRQLKKGVSVLVEVGHKRQILKHAFIGVGRGAKNVFEREYYEPPTRPFRPTFPYGILPKKYRLPVDRLTGPRIEDELGKERTLNTVQSDADRRFTENLNRELDFELSKLK
jgi:hypothetical protein